MQASVQRARPAANPQRKQAPSGKKQTGRATRLAPRPGEPFGPAYGCVEWFDYEEEVPSRSSEARD